MFLMNQITSRDGLSHPPSSSIRKPTFSLYKTSILVIQLVSSSLNNPCISQSGFLDTYQIFNLQVILAIHTPVNSTWRSPLAPVQLYQSSQEEYWTEHQPGFYNAIKVSLKSKLQFFCGFLCVSISISVLNSSLRAIVL